MHERHDVESDPSEPPIDGALPSSPAALPHLLRLETIERYRQQFFEEYQPVGPTELIIVMDLARKASAMERTDEAALAVERQAARELPSLLSPAGNGTPVEEEQILAGALMVPGAESCDRRSLGFARAFYRSLQKLEELQQRRKTQATQHVVQIPSFRDEAACEEYLIKRFQIGERLCLDCRSREGYFIKSRRSWECKGCKLQMGLRAGTVMARSPLTLLQWFEAIRWLLWKPTISLAELTEKIGLQRSATVRKIAGRIREAMSSEDASELLAGLDQHFSGGGIFLTQVSSSESFSRSSNVGESSRSS